MLVAVSRSVRKYRHNLRRAKPLLRNSGLRSVSILPLLAALTLSASLLWVFCGYSQTDGNLQIRKTWRIAVVFLGAFEDNEFQENVDNNISELLQIQPTEHLTLTVLRELPKRTVIYSADSRSAQSATDSGKMLFSSPPRRADRLATFGKVRSELRTSPSAPSIFNEPDRLKEFLNQFAFNESDNDFRFLVVYGHGFAFDGLKKISLRNFRFNLQSALGLSKSDGSGRPLDLLWFDSCFMSNLETLYELRKVSPLIVASEEAEFKTGSPFKSLQRLTENGDSDSSLAGQPLTVAVGLAEEFIESYSYLLKGEQRKSVKTSSSTISVIDTTLLPNLVQKISALSSKVAPLTAEQKTKLSRTVSKITMKDRDLIDFGNLVDQISKTSEFGEELRIGAKEIRQLLELNHQGRTKTNPRLRVYPPQNDQLMVYGFNDWKRGFENDQKFPKERLPKNLQPEIYVDGDKGTRWPARKIHKRLDLIPFSPGVESFQYYFADPATHIATSDIEEFERPTDLFIFTSKSALNPVRFSGYTQGVASFGEHYTGFSVANPLLGQSVGVEYPLLDFAKETQWGTTH